MQLREKKKWSDNISQAYIRPHTTQDLIQDLQATDTVPHTLLTKQEKMAYFSDFDSIPGISTKAEELANQLAQLPWKQVPASLWNNYVVWFPGLKDAHKRIFIRDLVTIFWQTHFLKVLDALPHFKNVFLFTLPQKGGNIPPHHHEQEARLFILDGSAGDISGNQVHAGEVIINAPFEKHAYQTEAGEKLLAISRWADDGILNFDITTGEFINTNDFIQD